MAGLKPLDAAFLRLENEHASLCIASTAIFEGPMPPRSALTVHLRARTRGLPRYHQVLREAPLHLGGPRWVNDPEFDISDHLFWAALPRPNSDVELDQFVARLMAVPIDRDRPLWETWFVEGLSDDRWAMVSKVHHSVVDGVGGAEYLNAVLRPVSDDASVVSVAPHVPAVPVSDPTSDGVLGAVTRRVRASATAARGVLRFAGLGVPTSESFLVGRLGRARAYATASVSLAEIGEIRHRFGGTVNDVMLAASASAFRGLLLSRGEDPERIGVRTLVPISIRLPEHDQAMDNHVTALVATLPVAEADPVDRLKAVHDEVQRLKDSGEPQAGVFVTDLLGRLPQGAVNAGLSAVFALHQWFLTTVTTNIPGSPVPLSLCGRRLVALYPYVPIADRIRIGIAMASYDGTMYIGVTSDRDHIGEGETLRMARAIAADVAELAQAAQAPGRSSGRRTRSS